MLHQKERAEKFVALLRAEPAGGGREFFARNELTVRRGRKHDVPLRSARNRGDRRTVASECYNLQAPGAATATTRCALRNPDCEQQ